MYASIRDGIVLHGWPEIGQGLEALGLEAVELEVTRDMKVRNIAPIDGQEWATLDSEQAISSYAEHLASAGVRASAFMLANDFNRADFRAEEDWVIEVVKAAASLAIPAVRIDAIMTGETDLPLEQRVTRFADSMKRVLDETDYHIVELGIENHGFQGNDPDFLDKVLASVGSPRLGLTLDTGNFYWAGHPLTRVYEIIRHFAGRVKHTHCKNIGYPAETREQQRELGWRYGDFVCPLDEGDIDHALVFEILRAGGYSGDLCIEDESLGRFPKEKWQEVLHKDANHFRSLLAEINAEVDRT